MVVELGTSLRKNLMPTEALAATPVIVSLSPNSSQGNLQNLHTIHKINSHGFCSSTAEKNEKYVKSIDKLRHLIKN